MTNTAKPMLPRLSRSDVMVEVDSGVITDHRNGTKSVRIKLDAGWGAVEVTLSGDELLRMMNGSSIHTEGSVWVPATTS